MRHAFTKYGGNLGTTGSVAYMFSRRAILMCETVKDEEAFMLQALEYDVEDVSFLEGGVACIEMQPTALESLTHFCTDQGLHILESDVLWQAENLVDVEAESAEKLEKLIMALEELDDVQAVYTSAAGV